MLHYLRRVNQSVSLIMTMQIKEKKQIDLDKPHRDVLPHMHHGYNHSEKDSKKGFANLTKKEKEMVNRVNKVWREKKDVV